MTRVKICGLTRPEDVDAAVDAGADFLGFNLWRGSPRRLAPVDARRLVERLPKTVIPVGVFVLGQPWDVSAAELTRVAWVQLHGAPAGWRPERFSRTVVRAVPVSGPVAPEALEPADYWIVDTAQRGHGGGGRTFDWKLAEALAGHARVFLAGGLDPDNVAGAIRALRPYAVDVASGCESSPGKKDAAKLRAFVQAVRQTDRELEGESRR